MYRFALAAALLLASPALGAAQSPLVGVWEVVSVETADGEVTQVTQPRYSAWFENGFYVLMWDVADGPRAPLGENATDAELVAAWGPVLAEFGTYEVNGSAYTRHILAGKNPNNQGTTLQSRSFSFEGGNLVTRGGGSGNTFTYRRVD